MGLTREQIAALWEEGGEPSRGARVISARPGTGKTYMLTRYCLALLDEWPTLRLPWQGLAALSYTNVAKRELEERIRTACRGSSALGSPHFFGTVDAFINQHVFLPHAAKVMRMGRGRPKLVGPPHSTWKPTWNQRNDKPDNASSPVFFDCYTLTADGPLLVDRSPRATAPNRTKAASAVSSQNAAKIEAMKAYVWSLGFATQADANYLSLQVLIESPTLTMALVRRYPHIVIDEAQDLTAVQHALFDHLRGAGLESSILVGDENQAIYEWNTARPQLFVAKRQSDAWVAKSLTGTFRCSEPICQSLRALAGSARDELIPAQGSVASTYKEAVRVHEYERGSEPAAIRAAIAETVNYLRKCVPHDKNPDGIKKVAVLGRSREDVAAIRRAYLGDGAMPSMRPPVWSEASTRDFLRVADRLVGGDPYGAVQAYEFLLYNASPFEQLGDLRAAVQAKFGWNLLQYRSVLFADVMLIFRALPGHDEEVMIADCARCIGSDLQIFRGRGRKAVYGELDNIKAGSDLDRVLSTVFGGQDYGADRVPDFRDDEIEIVFSTVHGVKGETYDGVVFFTKLQTGSCGCEAGSSNRWPAILKHSLVECETKRVAYVALSRAAQCLTVLAPGASAPGWRQFGSAL
jgi:DNA helicase II / ATP-dependent DNA helicase PcrA